MTGFSDLCQVFKTWQVYESKKNMETPKIKLTNRIIALFLLMLVFHVAHVFEEVYGRFWILNNVGLKWFLIINWILFLFPVFFFYLLLSGYKYSFYLGMLYSIIMIINGVMHNVAYFVTGKYFDGFAGGITGLFLILIGIPLFFNLKKQINAVSI